MVCAGRRRSETNERDGGQGRLHSRHCRRTTDGGGRLRREWQRRVSIIPASLLNQRHNEDDSPSESTSAARPSRSRPSKTADAASGQSPFYAKPETDALVGAIREAVGGRLRGRPGAAGICVPGLMDREKRMITLSVNVPGLMGVVLDELVERRRGRGCRTWRFRPTRWRGRMTWRIRGDCRGGCSRWRSGRVWGGGVGRGGAADGVGEFAGALRAGGRDVARRAGRDRAGRGAGVARRVSGRERAEESYGVEDLAEVLPKLTVADVPMRGWRGTPDRPCVLSAAAPDPAWRTRDAVEARCARASRAGRDEPHPGGAGRVDAGSRRLGFPRGPGGGEDGDARGGGAITLPKPFPHHEMERDFAIPDRCEGNCRRQHVKLYSIDS